MTIPLAIRRIDTRNPDATSQIAALRTDLAPEGNVVSAAGRKKTIDLFGEPLAPVQVVERICQDVRERGLEAVLHYTAKLDGKQLAPDQLRVPVAELEAAHNGADPAFLDTVRRIRENILRFQKTILHTDVTMILPHGGTLQQRYLPLDRAGICVPGGAAAYPSTVLMTAVPAQAAGVRELAVVAPPTPYGSYNHDLLAVCHELEIDEVYRVGGAQAVAALAYGTDRLPQVDKIVGPGNLFVALAKKYVYGHVDIDSIAGPSEVLVMADETTRVDYVAADMIAQAEHAPGSSIVISWHEPLLDALITELEKQLASLARGDLARASLESFGALLLTRERDEAAALANDLASEHLHIACANADGMLKQIRHAGAIFIGPTSPVPLGDYVAGPSHVLPTGATARFASGLSSNDFLRAGSVIHFSQKDLELVADDAQLMAEKEGLTGHGASIKLRRDKKSNR